MPCCHLTRRELLALTAAAAVPLVAVLDPERAYALPRQADPTIAVVNLELVTLTETTAVLTWYTGRVGTPDATGRLAPVPTDTVVLLGTGAGTLREAYRDDTTTPYHYVELTGLEPGRTYSYVATSNGQPATPAPFGQGNAAGTGPATSGTVAAPNVFTTPQPPPGSYLFSLALCNDIHIGETVAGLATSVGGQGVPPGISQYPGLPPYPEVMAKALVDDTRARGASLLLAAGDVTAEAEQRDVLRARQILDGFGTLGRDYLVARGNHDRSHQGSSYGVCSPSKVVPGFNDCYADTFAVGDTTWFSSDHNGLHVVGLDTYNKAGNGGDNGMLSAAQEDWLVRDLAQNPDRPTIVFGHHPVTVESDLVNLAPGRFDLDAQQALRLEQLYARTPGVFLHHAGHTHRNKRTAPTVATNVVFQEVAATKEYPGGFTLLRVFTGGYAVNFYKTRADLAREWSERTRQEYGGASAMYTGGTIGDRNYVVARDLSGLAPAAALPESPLATALPVAAALAGVGAVAAVSRRRSRDAAAHDPAPPAA